MEPDWLKNDIKLESGQVVIVEDIEKYKLKNPIEFVSRSIHKNYIQLGQKLCLQNISKKSIGVIGLDCEWNWKTGSVVDLIQISTPDINLAFQNFDRLPPELNKILRNENIKKVGVNIADDLNRISEKYQVEVSGALDLRTLRSGSLDFLGPAFYRMQFPPKNGFIKPKKRAQF